MRSWRAFRGELSAAVCGVCGSQGRVCGVVKGWYMSREGIVRQDVRVVIGASRSWG